jgi:hypothetical protein
MTTEVQPDAYALLESHFNAPPTLRHYEKLPRRSDEYRNIIPTAAPLVLDTLRADDDTESVFSSSQPTPLEPPAAVNGADSGLPPTPPTMSQDGQSTQSLEPSPHPDSVVASLLSKKSTLSTPVNARSPPTPDPSPPRAASTANAVSATPERPPLFTYPSSRAESFQTAREEISSEPSCSTATTPIGAFDRLSTVEEDRGLGLAFEIDENDSTPTDHTRPFYPCADEADTMAGAEEDKGTPVEENIPDREWNTDMMRNVTIRRKRMPKSSPSKDSAPAVDIVETASPSPSPRPRRTSGLRERVKASTNSPVTPSIENFAQSIGWPSDTKATPDSKEREESNKRNSTSSMASRVEARIIVTPPRRTQTLRHSGKNLALRDGSPTPDISRRRSTRESSHADDVPLHRLVHKKVTLADRSKRLSTDSTTLGSTIGSAIGSGIGYERRGSTIGSAIGSGIGYERSMSSPLSFRSRVIDTSASTLAHQESLRNVLQPAADILSRSSSVYHNSEANYHRRIGSAPEPVRKSALSSGPRQYSQLSQQTNSRRAPNVSFQTPLVEQSPQGSPTPSIASPRSLKRRQRSNVGDARQQADAIKSPLAVPLDYEGESASQDAFLGASAPVQDSQASSALLERVRLLMTARDAPGDDAVADARVVPTSPEQDHSPPLPRGSRSARRRSSERRHSSLSQDRVSTTSPEFAIRPSLDIASERVSFDRSNSRTDEHGQARHLFSSTTPFSQFSDTPVEVSEATAVSIYPHNNHSLLVVQQGSRVGSMTPEPRQLTEGTHLSVHDRRELRSTPTPPFVDAIEDYDDADVDGQNTLTQPTLTIEPSTPPMQIDLPHFGAVDSPLKNPRAPPEPPKIMFIPPTPAEELERELVPGPPKRSDSHPQRRLSLVQRARRYSGNLVPTLLSRASINRGRNNANEAQRVHHNPEVPSVNDEDGTLHPFWRPRGFWDGFEDDDSDSEDDGLHPGGDTSDVETIPERPRRAKRLQRRLTSSVRGSGGFLIGNSLGVERHGTNKRPHRVTLPPHFYRAKTSDDPSSPRSRVQSPVRTRRESAISSTSGSSLSSHGSPQRRGTWRHGRSLPGLRKYQVQYIGLSGVKKKFRENRQEKRRQKIRQSIGTRYYVESSGPNAS